MEKRIELEQFAEELKTVAEVQRKKDEEEKAKKDEEARVAALGLVSKTTTKISKGINDYFEEKSGLGEEMKAKLTPFWVRTIGLLSNLCFIAILIGFTYSGYSADQQQKYLSLDNAARDNGNPTSDYRTCLTVPFAITKMYTLDTNGVWSGASAYVPGKALYAFDLNYFEKSTASYKAFMLDVKSRIAGIAAGASSRNLAGNLGYLMSKQFKITDTPISTKTSVTDVVSIKGDAAYVFDKFYKSASLGSPTQQCLQSPDIVFNRATGVFLVQYDYAGYFASDSSLLKGCCKLATGATTVSDGDCILPPPDYGYKKSYDSTHFNIRYNVYSLTSAHAVNQGIADYSLLDVVQTDLTKSKEGCYSLNSECSATTDNTVCTGSVTASGSVTTTSPSITGLPVSGDTSSGGQWPPVPGMGASGTNIPSGATVASVTPVTTGGGGGGPPTTTSYTVVLGSGNPSAPVTFPTAGPLSITFTKVGFTSTGLLYDKTKGTCSIKVGDTRLYIEARMDGQLSGMDPIYCLVENVGDSSAKQCFVRVGNTFVLPFFNHIGISGKPGGDFYNYKTSCGCKAPSFASTPSQTYSHSTTAAVNVAGHRVVKMDGTNLATGFSPLVGCTVTGTGIPAGATVTAGNTTDITLSADLTANLGTLTTLTFTCPMSTYYSNIYGTADTTSSVYGTSDGYCSMFDLVHGFVLLKGKYYDAVLYNWMNSIIGAKTALYTPAQINEMATVAAWTSLKFGGNAGGGGGPSVVSAYTEAAAKTALLPNNGQLGVNAYSWCSPTQSNVNCAVLALNTVDLYNQRINAEGGIAAASSCNDEFTMDSTAWVSTDGKAGAAIVPPTNLFQDYYECYNTEVKSVLIAFGAGSGSAGSLTPLFVAICVVMVTQFCIRNAPEAIEAMVDAEHAMEELMSGHHEAEAGAAAGDDKMRIELSGVRMQQI